MEGLVFKNSINYFIIRHWAVWLFLTIEHQRLVVIRKSIMKNFYIIRELIKFYLLDIKAKNFLSDFVAKYKVINEIVEKPRVILSAK